MEKTPKDYFKEKIKELIKIFRLNIIKACLISELKKENIEDSFHESISKDLKDLEEHEGIENIAKSQGIVMLVTSFEAYCKDLFKTILIFDNHLLKQALKKLELRWSSIDLVNLMNKPEIIGDLIISKRNFNFQNFESLKRCFDLINIDLEDECCDAERDVKKENIKGQIEDFDGLELLKETFNNRHKIIHEGITIGIEDYKLNLIIQFIQILALNLVSKFCDLEMDVFNHIIMMEIKKQINPKE